MFVTDFTGAGGKDVTTSIDIVKRSTDSLNVGKDKIRVGLISNDCPDVKNIPLNRYYYYDAFMNAVQKTNSKSLTDLLVQTRRTLTVSRNGSRRRAKKVAVVLVNGPIKDLKSVAIEVQRAEYKKVKFVFVKSGSGASLKQLQQLSRFPVLDAESVDFKNDLTDRLCEGRL